MGRPGQSRGDVASMVSLASGGIGTWTSGCQSHGSPVADRLHSGELDLDNKISLSRQLLIKIQFSFERILLLGVCDEALRDLTSNAAKNWKKNLKKRKKPLHAEISKRLFFITSSESAKDTCFYLSNASNYLEAYHGRNDGLVLLKDQSLNGIGKTFEFKADHGDFVLPWPFSKHKKEFRTAFGNALVTWLTLRERGSV